MFCGKRGRKENMKNRGLRKSETLTKKNRRREAAQGREEIILKKRS